MTLTLSMETKVCGACRQAQPLPEYGVDSTKSDGLRRICKPCDRAASAVRYKKTRARRLDSMRRYDEEHRGKRRSRDVASVDRHRQVDATWRARNRSRLTAYEARRRASKVACTYLILESEWDRMVSRYRGLCAYCRMKPWEHRDHVVPLSRGGQHSIGNLLPSCSTCNYSKKNSTLMEWRKRMAS